ncbi:UNKNOWN [Stylonychia lemnae]|uniref:Uncharacterized protein n=1 Tax=Stylonychia lemnae TaxID=5949 RepID=A0A078ABS1_STYLE|nr:UNKNOWN [Stylonychia lemnae]|eukprot:CDW78228.1 UNKNOWN [Stylonychia lemnae]
MKYISNNQKKLNKAKDNFIYLLKSFLKEDKGNQIYDMVTMNLPAEINQISGGKIQVSNFEVTVDLEIDLMNMIYFDQFLAENFIRCFFRYYPKLSIYIKEVFIEIYTQEQMTLIKHTSQNSAQQYEREHQFKMKVADLEMGMVIKLNLRISHFPYFINQIDPATLLSNSILRNHGQLIQLKLVRVLNVFQPSLYLYSKLYKRQCKCVHQPEIITEINTNPLKIFKNQVNYSNKMGKHLYYDTLNEDKDITCDDCDTKYTVAEQKYASCQKAEILALCDNQKKKVISLTQNISTLWLIEPFLNSIQIGQVINLTGYYFMFPQQQFINERCISALLGAIVAFNVIKVNPFHQMIGKDSALASLFYCNSTNSVKTSKSINSMRNKSLLTLDNIKMHDVCTQNANNKFYPKINRLNDLANRRAHRYQGPSTNYSGTFSIFEALYEIESFNQISDQNSTKNSQKTQSDSQQNQVLSQEEYRDVLLQKMLALDDLDDQFSKIHLLVDKLFENQKNMSQNSNMFHLKFSLLLSSIVQMKNSLMKYLEHESQEQVPELQLWTQKPIIQSFNPETNSEEEYSFFTPIEHQEENTENIPLAASRENINLLLLTTDSVHIDSLIATMNVKGVKIVEFPNIYEPTSIIPFLLMNDHSIIIFRNPKKDLLNLIKLIIRKGFIYLKQSNTPIQVNFTIWVMIDTIAFNDKLKGNKKGQKSLQEVIVKEYGIDFPNLFDVIVDNSIHSNVQILGTDFLRYNDNLILDRLSLNLEQGHPEFNKEFIFDYRDLKCFCKPINPHQGGSRQIVNISDLQLSKLSVGELFIQYYYLCQRKQHQENDTNAAFYKDENGNAANEIHWMSLTDVVKVKKIADSINFMRLFYLKSSDDQINQIKLERGIISSQFSNKSVQNQGIEIIDCVMSIFLYELTRLSRGKQTLYSKDQFQYKILNFFSGLKLCRVIDNPNLNLNPSDVRRPKARTNYLEEDQFDLDERQNQEPDLLDGLIEQMKVDLKIQDDQIESCANCKTKARENLKFRNLYKTLIENILRNINNC